MLTRDRWDRPERVGDGKFRLFISRNLKEENMDSDNAKRICQHISKAMDDVNAAAVELADISQPGVSRHKRARTNADREPASRAELAVNPALERDVGLDFENAVSMPRIPWAPPMSITRTNKISPSTHTMDLGPSSDYNVERSSAQRGTRIPSSGSSNARVSTTSSITVNSDANLSANIIDGTQLWLERSELLSLVHLLRCVACTFFELLLMGGHSATILWKSNSLPLPSSEN